jgi:hypothetical protein
MAETSERGQQRKELERELRGLAEQCRVELSAGASFNSTDVTPRLERLADEMCKCYHRYPLLVRRDTMSEGEKLLTKQQRKAQRRARNEASRHVRTEAREPKASKTAKPVAAKKVETRSQVVHRHEMEIRALDKQGKETLRKAKKDKTTKKNMSFKNKDKKDKTVVVTKKDKTNVVSAKAEILRLEADLRMRHALELTIIDDTVVTKEVTDQGEDKLPAAECSGDNGDDAAFEVISDDDESDESDDEENDKNESGDAGEAKREDSTANSRAAPGVASKKIDPKDVTTDEKKRGAPTCKRTLAVAVNCDSQRVYYGMSGKYKWHKVHGSIWGKSLVKGRPRNNCAEFRVANEALMGGDNLNDQMALLVVDIVTGEAKPRCMNCLHITRGCFCLSDALALDADPDPPPSTTAAAPSPPVN